MVENVKYRCPLCGLKFDDDSACHRCALNRNCKSIKCPNCGYEFIL